MTDLSIFEQTGVLKTAEEVFLEDCRRMDDFTVHEWLPFWVPNAAENFQVVPKDPRSLKTLSHLKNIHWGQEAAILASGPSLDDSIQYLPRFKGLIFAGNSTINPCIANGIKPDWVHVLDADEYVPKQFVDIDCSQFKAILPTYIYPSVPKLFNSDLIWWFNIYDYRYWFTKDGLHYLFPHVDGLPASSNCPIAMIRLAHWMGIRRVYLLGSDLGFPQGKQRCSIWHKEDGIWIKGGMDEFAFDTSPRETINGIETSRKLKVAKHYMVEVIKSLPELEVIDCSKGILTEFQKKDFGEVVNDRG